MSTDATTEPTGPTASDDEVEPAGVPGGTPVPDGTGEPDTFTREYVESLRAHTAKYRTRAAHADVLAQRLLEATVREACAELLADVAGRAAARECLAVRAQSRGA